jgi:hypothetical protein
MTGVSRTRLRVVGDTAGLETFGRLSAFAARHGGGNESSADDPPMLPRHPFTFTFALSAALAATIACSGELGSPSSALAQAPFADVRAPVVGVPDRGADPAVVAVESAGVVVCAGAVVAADVVLTAGHCVTTAGADLSVRMGETGADGPAAGVRSIATPPEANAPDIALLLLDTPLDGVVPLAVRSTGVALGDHVRTVTFDARAAQGGVVKVVRDHVLVVAESGAEAFLGEAPCSDGCGGPAIDDATASVVGVLSRAAAGGGTGMVGDLAARSDVLASFIAGVLAAAAPSGATGTALRTTKGPVDFGASCSSAVDCAAGVCVSDGPRRYCSRSCAESDRCPARSRCVLCQEEVEPRASAPVAFAACVES